MTLAIGFEVKSLTGGEEYDLAYAITSTVASTDDTV